eukprot:TRINITY_DN11571_c0_g1_i1.p1 TRINITY_DN11571_c0_g1~~TRINITY_DN11571_c0_g1_i1.p1  ORF type:complete len:379 (+),score=54.86 TRINITY_DN11571_c0_g1_i1:39-1139(+)
MNSGTKTGWQSVEKRSSRKKEQQQPKPATSDDGQKKKKEEENSNNSRSRRKDDGRVNHRYGERCNCKSDRLWRKHKREFENRCEDTTYLRRLRDVVVATSSVGFFLPVEVLVHIFSYLKEWKDHKSCSLVCKNFYEASKWYRTSVRPARFKSYEALIAAFPRLQCIVIDSCLTSHPIVQACMENVHLLEKLVLWNVAAGLLKGEFPSENSPWRRTVKKIIAEGSYITPPAVEWHFDNVEELEIYSSKGNEWASLIQAVSPTLRKLKITLSMCGWADEANYYKFLHSIRSCGQLREIFIESCDDSESIDYVLDHYYPLLSDFKCLQNLVVCRWNHRSLFPFEPEYKEGTLELLTDFDDFDDFDDLYW